MLKHLHHKIKARAGTCPRIINNSETGRIHPIEKNLLTDSGLPRKVRVNLLCFIVQVILTHITGNVKSFFEIYLIFFSAEVITMKIPPKSRNNAAVKPLNHAPFVVQ